MNNNFDKLNNNLIQRLKCEVQKQTEDLEKGIKEGLKEIFSNKIKISFLFEVYNKIQTQTNHFMNIYKYYPYQNNDPIIRILTTEDKPELDVANHITGIHNFNMILIDDEKRASYQKDNKYIDQIIEQVNRQIRLREWGSQMFFKDAAFSDTNYLYYPPVYYNFVCSNYLSEFLNDHYKKIEKGDVTLNNLLIHILDKFKGIKSLIENECYDSCFALLRVSLELYAIYLVLKYCTIDKKYYWLFEQFKLDFDANKAFDKEFDLLYDNMDKNVNVGKMDYLNYGWIDFVFEMGYLNKKKVYKFSDITELLNLVMQKFNYTNYGDKIRELYNRCHIYVHGNVFASKHSIIDVMHVCDISEFILGGVAKEIRESNKRMGFIDGIDMFKENKDFNDKFRKLINNTSMEEMDEYYRKKTFKNNSNKKK